MHPCCGGSLQTGTKIIAIVSMVFSIILIVIGILGIAGGAVITAESQKISEKVEAGGTKVDKDDVEVTGAAVIIASIVFTIAFVISLLFAILLLVGANKRNRTMCMVWFVISAIGLVLVVIRLFTSLTYDSVPRTTGRFVGILLQSYFLWVVWAFMSELKEGPATVGYNANTKA